MGDMQQIDYTRMALTASYGVEATPMFPPRDYWPQPATWPDRWLPRLTADLQLAERMRVYTARNSDGQFFALHTSDLDDHTDYYWADDMLESKLYESAGAVIEDMDRLGYSGPCTIVEWEMAVVNESEVIV